ncbi:putative N-acetyltransferase YhbS [Pontibacter sp. HSC-36F09]|nr:putative N-acetyltransferase YhbS [Pontibacter sp. HSC-36F09]
MSDHKEQFLAERLRKSNSFIPKLSLVAVKGVKVVGHILLTKLEIKNKQQLFESLSLAPVAVLPAYQHQGIGAMLIEQAHKVAKSLGYTSFILVGHENYYPRFGYKRASTFGITFPFEVPDANAMAVELVENGLAGISGEVKYPKEFF